MDKPVRLLVIAMISIIVGYLAIELDFAVSKRNMNNRLIETRQSTDNFQRESDQIRTQLELKLSEDERRREAEREELRRKIESEEATKIWLGAAQGRVNSAYKSHRNRQNQAWLEFYNAPDECQGRLSSEMSNRCVQRRRDARRVFFQNFEDSKYNEDLEAIESEFSVRVIRQSEGVPELQILAPYDLEAGGTRPRGDR